MRSMILFLALAAAAVAVSPVFANDEGQAELDQATEAKLNAKTLTDLDEVIRLTEAALKKGLSEGNAQFANGLLAATLAQRGGIRAALTARTQPTNPRFPEFRQAALDDLERAVKIDPKQAQAWLFIAQLNHLPGGDPKRGAAALEEALKAAANDPELKARALFTRAALTEDNEKKLADLNEAVGLAPGDAAIVRARGLLKANMGKPEEALADLNKAIELDSDDGPTYEAKAIVLARLKRFDEALATLQKLHELQPDSIEPLVQMARIHIAKDDLKAALAQIEEAKRKDPSNVALYILQAAMEEEPARKLAALDEAVKLSPRNVMALRARAGLLADQEKFDAALADLDKAIEQQPKDLLNYEAKAAVLIKAKRAGDAVAVADRMVELDSSPEVRRFRAGVLAEADRFDEAVDILRRMFEESSEDLVSGLALAQLYHQKKKITPAIAAYSAVLGRQADLLPALRGRGDAYLNIGKHAEAIADYEKALKIDPRDSGVLNNLAWVLCTSPNEKLRDGRRAIKLATDACEITDYKMPHILSTLGAAYAEIGDFENAKKWVKKGLELADEKEKEALAKELQHYERGEPVRELLNEEAEATPEKKPDAQPQSKPKGQPEAKPETKPEAKPAGDPPAADQPAA